MGQEEDRKRIEDDIELFDKNIRDTKATKGNRHILELAKSYRDDTLYFLGKKDYMSAFGCINYAHGLLDALRKKAKE